MSTLLTRFAGLRGSCGHYLRGLNSDTNVSMCSSSLEKNWLPIVELQIIKDHPREVAFVEVSEPGSSVAQGSSYGAVESVTATSDVNSPISGEVVEVNSKLTESPDLVTPYSNLLYISKAYYEGMKMVAEYKAQKKKNDERVILAKKFLLPKVKATQRLQNPPNTLLVKAWGEALQVQKMWQAIEATQVNQRPRKMINLL
ncbi:hypothetical protein C3L33_22636, partial [Rhododendron williamsianum]